ncbi:MAG: H-NS histone family protein [Pseudomonas sp.]|nr:MAG: H-NS histone family protein [Pseudomonas sp.]
MTSLHELLDRKAELDKQVASIEKQLQAARQVERQSVIVKIKALMAEHGLTAADLNAVKTSVRTHPAAGRTVAPKYRSASTGETWSGRGLKPKWVQAALNSGKSLQDLAI